LYIFSQLLKPKFGYTRAFYQEWNNLGVVRLWLKVNLGKQQILFLLLLSCHCSA